jgi:hypothetical protein
MPFTQEGLPFGSASASSYKAGVTLERKPRTESVKMRRYLEALATHGRLTDHEAHEVTGLPLQSICSIRYRLQARVPPSAKRRPRWPLFPLVRAAGEKPGPYGTPCTLWELTDEGWRHE